MLANIDVNAPSETYQPGDIVIREGDEGTQAYYIRSGHLEVFTHIGDMDIILATLGPGEIVGEMALLFGEPRNASVRAASLCELASIDKETVLRSYNKAPPGLKAIIDSMADRIRRSNARAVALAQEAQHWEMLESADAEAEETQDQETSQ